MSNLEATAMGTTTTDRIEKHILLRAPRARVWRALTDSSEFGSWFRAIFTAPFKPGERLKGRCTYPGHEQVVFDITIEAVEPERRFSYRWLAEAAAPGVDTSSGPMTRVEFTLDDVEGGTLLKLVESGYDQIPIARRAEAFKANEQGWTVQMAAIEVHLITNP